MSHPVMSAIKDDLQLKTTTYSIPLKLGVEFGYHQGLPAEGKNLPRTGGLG